MVRKVLLLTEVGEKKHAARHLLTQQELIPKNGDLIRQLSLKMSNSTVFPMTI